MDLRKAVPHFTIAFTAINSFSTLGYLIETKLNEFPNRALAGQVVKPCIQGKSAGAQKARRLASAWTHCAPPNSNEDALPRLRSLLLVHLFFVLRISHRDCVSQRCIFRSRVCGRTSKQPSEPVRIEVPEVYGWGSSPQPCPLSVVCIGTYMDHHEP